MLEIYDYEDTCPSLQDISSLLGGKMKANRQLQCDRCYSKENTKEDSIRFLGTNITLRSVDKQVFGGEEKS